MADIEKVFQTVSSPSPVTIREYITGRSINWIYISRFATVNNYNVKQVEIVKLRERKGQRVDSGRPLKGHL